MYNHAGSFPDLEWATPFEKRILDTWPRLADPKIVSDEKRLLINWTEKTAKSETGIWFARPGKCFVDKSFLCVVDVFLDRLHDSRSGWRWRATLLRYVSHVVPQCPGEIWLIRFDDSIRREDARDLRTIRETLQRSKEGVTLESLDADIYQMLANARKFNPEGSLVNEAAIDIGKRWDQLRAEIEMGRRGQYWAPNDADGSRSRR